MWFNVGYWKNVHSYKSGINPFILACREMTNLLASSVGLENGEIVIDTGSGCGEQDFHLLEQFPKSKIVAVELSPYQVSYAVTKANTIGAEQVHFEVGNAVELDNVLQRESVRQFLGEQFLGFDVALALDCAYHFRFRTNFFKQVFQVLKPGGRIGLADVCLAEGVDMAHLNTFKRFGLKWMLRKISIPPENLVDIQTYKRNLEDCGFSNVTITTITEHVFEGLLRFIEDAELRLGAVITTHRLNKLLDVAAFLRMVIKRKLLEYVIVSAVKVSS